MKVQIEGTYITNTLRHLHLLPEDEQFNELNTIITYTKKIRGKYNKGIDYNPEYCKSLKRILHVAVKKNAIDVVTFFTSIFLIYFLKIMYVGFKGIQGNILLLLIHFNIYILLNNVNIDLYTYYSISKRGLKVYKQIYYFYLYTFNIYIFIK